MHTPHTMNFVENAHEIMEQANSNIVLKGVLAPAGMERREQEAAAARK
jgi:hypothetical protein